MLTVSEAFKQAMHQSVKSLRSSVVVLGEPEQTICENDGLVSFSIESDGFLFGSVASLADVKLAGVNFNLVGKEILLKTSTKINQTTNEYEELVLGRFTVSEQVVDLEKGSTTLKCLNSILVMAKSPYNTGELTFPSTVGNLINQIASKFDLTIEGDTSTLPNIDYQIGEDPYAKISNLTYRDIISEIAGATASMALVRGNKLIFLPPVSNISQEWTYDNLKTVKFEPKYGPINALVLARTPQEDNVTVRNDVSIANNGLTDVKLANNEILDDNREAVINPIFNAIKGFSLYPFEAQTEGHGYYEIGDRVSLSVEQEGIREIYGNTTQTKYNGKNLLKCYEYLKESSNGIKITKNNSIKLSGIVGDDWDGFDISDYTGFDVPIVLGTYTLSITKKLPFDILLALKHNDTSIDDVIITAGSTKKTFVINTTINKIAVYCLVDAGTLVENSFNMQLEGGNKATDWEPYVGSQPSPSPSYPQEIKTVSLGSLELCKVGDYQDRIFYDDGWRLEKKIGKIELAGNENFEVNLGGDDENQCYAVSSQFNDIIADTEILPLCSHFKTVNLSIENDYGTNESIMSVKRSLGFEESLKFMFTPGDTTKFNLIGANELKAWLKAQKNTGKPVTIYFVLATPTITPIADQSLITQLNGYVGTKEVTITHLKLEVSQGIKETLSGVAPTKEQTDYARAGGIIKTIYNTEIKVDKQNQEIKSIVSRTDQLDNRVTENYTQITQNINSITNTIQTTGGANLLYNSVGYATDTSQVPTVWLKNGTVKANTSAESLTYGAKSGSQIILEPSSSISQTITVAPNQPLSLSARVKKSLIGQAAITISTSDADRQTITLADQQEYFWQEVTLADFKPAAIDLTVKIEVSDNATLFITDLMLNIGDKTIPWQQASGEIMNTNVLIDKDGVTIKNSTYSGDYMKFTPIEIANYSNASGSEKKTFWLNRDLTNVQKLQAVDQIEMPPIRIVPVANGNRAGWSFVASKGEN